MAINYGTENEVFYISGVSKRKTKFLKIKVNRNMMLV